jgi:hypothetical protein
VNRKIQPKYGKRKSFFDYPDICKERAIDITITLSGSYDIQGYALGDKYTPY